MQDKFRGQYRIPSARAQWWDYGWNGAYFITGCTKNKKHYFGSISNGEMRLSRTGVVADILWREIPHHARHISLGAFQLMPNHFHGILILHAPDGGDGDYSASDLPTAETGHALSLQPGKKRFRNQGKNTVSSIIGGYKAAVKKHANRLGFEFDWQTRFHDHIIRNRQAFDTISQYVLYNVQNWEKDCFYTPGDNSGFPFHT